VTRFPLIEAEKANGKASELLSQVERALGLVPNMTKAMANSPALLAGYLQLSGALSQGVLSPAVREQLAIATAQINGCEYCLSAHTYVGRELAKVDEADLEKARRGESNDPHAAALLALSNAIVLNKGKVDASTLDAARAAGVTEQEIGEVVGHIALNTMTNFFNIVAEVPNDWPVVAVV
jgi:uncharacterized peroxidase-related enzyme